MGAMSDNEWEALDEDYEEQNHLKFKKKGVYHSNHPFISNALSAEALWSDVLYAWPVVVTEDQLFDGIAVDVTVADAVDTGLRLGIYENAPEDDDPGPRTLLLDAGAVSVAATGIKVIATNIKLKKEVGLYWVVLLTESGATVRRPSNSSGANILGIPLGGTGVTSGYQKTGVSYGALPTVFPSGYATMNYGCYVFLRKV